MRGWWTASLPACVSHRIRYRPEPRRSGKDAPVEHPRHLLDAHGRQEPEHLRRRAGARIERPVDAVNAAEVADVPDRRQERLVLELLRRSDQQGLALRSDVHPRHVLRRRKPRTLLPRVPGTAGAGRRTLSSGVTRTPRRTRDPAQGPIDALDAEPANHRTKLRLERFSLVLGAGSLRESSSKNSVKRVRKPDLHQELTGEVLEILSVPAMIPITAHHLRKPA